MRKTAVLAAATAALTVGSAAAASAAVLLPPTPSFTYISTAPYVDRDTVLLELDTSEGLRAALHLGRMTVVDAALGNYVNPMTGVRGPYLRILDCRYAADIACRINRAAFVGTISSVKLPAPATTSITKTTVVSTVDGAVSKVTTTVTTIKQSVPAVKAPAVTLPTITVPTITVPVVTVPQVPAPQGLLSGVLGAVGDTVDAVLGTTPVPAPPAPAPQSLLGALLG